jgi:galactose-1-phosphate uridylyltransferase
MSRILFEKEVREAELLNPFLNFAVETQLIEYRRDPLTGGWGCRVNMKRAERVKQASQGERGEELEIVERSRKGCFFCPENLEKSTPKFPSDLAPEGRLRVGSACLFPNLYPFGEYHAIAIFSEDHHVSLDQFPAMIIKDCMKASKEYLDRIYTKKPRIKYGLINWNQMPPAGASITHPHLQILAEHKPTQRLDELIQSSQAYCQRYGSNYWSDLTAAEKEGGERFIGETGGVTWLASYAPQGNNEVLGVFSDISTVLMMGEQHIWDFSEGLSRILAGYHEIGVKSFNMTMYSGPFDQDLNYYSLHIKMVSRPNPKVFYTNDSGFMERLQNEVVVETRPEDVAEKLRGTFQKYA